MLLRVEFVVGEVIFMMKKLILFFFIPVVLLGATGPEDLLYITEDYAPSNYLEKGELKGVSVDLLKAIWIRMGVGEQPIEVYPWARGYQMVQNRPDTVLFAMTRNNDREDLFKWVGPIYRGRYSLITLSSMKPENSNTDILKSRRIGALRNDLGYDLLIREGLSRDQIWEATSVEQLVKMLEAGRIDYISIYEDSIHQYSSASGNELRFQTVRVLSENVMYYAFNLHTDSALIEKFQNALKDIDDQRKAIVEKYSGIP